MDEFYEVSSESINYLEEAKKIAKEKDYKNALPLFNKAIEKDIFNSNAYFHRAVLYSDNGKIIEAIADYSVAIILNPYGKASYNNRGYNYKRLKKYERGINDFNEAINIDSKYVKAYNNRCSCLVSVQQYKLAISDSKKVKELNPTLISNLLNLVEFYIITDSYELAIKEIELIKECGQLEYEHRVIIQYFECISKRMLDDLSILDCVSDFKKIIKERSNEKIHWNFLEIAVWLEKKTLSFKKKRFVFRLTKMLNPEFKLQRDKKNIFGKKKEKVSNQCIITCPQCKNTSSILKDSINENNSNWVDVTTYNDKNRKLICSHCKILISLENNSTILKELRKMTMKDVLEINRNDLKLEIYTISNLLKLYRIISCALEEESEETKEKYDFSTINDVIIFLENSHHNPYDNAPKNLEEFVKRGASIARKRSIMQQLNHYMEQEFESYTCPICGEQTSSPDWCGYCGNNI